MKKDILIIASGLLLTTAAIAQKAPAKVEKKEITIEKKEGTKKEKMEIVINGDKVSINGKPAEEYKGDVRIVIDEDIIINGDQVIVPGHKGKVTVAGTQSTRPLLGVTTEKAGQGVKINSVTDESGAEKAGLKSGDIITMINQTPVSNPEELTGEIRKHKPGETIDITFIRAGKNQKVKATLGKTAETYTWNSDEFNYNFEGGKPYVFKVPRQPYTATPDYWEGHDFDFMVHGSGNPRYGMGIQDDEDGRGVLVTNVDDESNADKGGLKEDDVITEIDGEKVKGVDDFKSKLASKKENPSISIKVLRDGKTESLTIRVPKKLKSANL